MTKRYILSTRLFWSPAIELLLREATTETLLPANKIALTGPITIFFNIWQPLLLSYLVNVIQGNGPHDQIQRLNLSRTWTWSCWENQYLAILNLYWRKVTNPWQSYPHWRKNRTLIWGTITLTLEELDNSLPPWAGLDVYLTILFSGVYMWWYHWSDNRPDQIKGIWNGNGEGQKVKRCLSGKDGRCYINENSVTQQDLLLIWMQEGRLKHLESGAPVA